MSGQLSGEAPPLFLRGRYPYEHETLAELERLTKEMDRKIQRAKERAEKESQPRPLSAEDKVALDELDTKMKGEAWGQTARSHLIIRIKNSEMLIYLCG